MKRARYVLPAGIAIRDIARWCGENDVPMIYSLDSIRWGRKACLRDFLSDAKTVHPDTLIIREQDYELVRVRF